VEERGPGRSDDAPTGGVVGRRLPSQARPPGARAGRPAPTLAEPERFSARAGESNTDVIALRSSDAGSGGTAGRWTLDVDPAQGGAWVLASPGLGWEEPAGRVLPWPAVSSEGEDRGAVAQLGGGVARPGSSAPVAVAMVGDPVAREGGRGAAVASPGGLADAEAGGVVAEGDGWNTSERVSTRRQVALLGCAGALFAVSAVALLALGWMVLPAFAPAVPPAPAASAVAPSRMAPADAAPPRDVADAAPAAPVPPTRPVAPSPELAADGANGRAVDPGRAPSPRVADKPPPAKPGSTFGDDPPAPPPRPTAEPPPVAPRPKPAAAPSGRLTFAFADGFLGAQLSIKCPSGTQSFDLRPPSSSVPAIPDDCSVYVRCNGGTPVSASRLPHSGAATCGGCTRTDTRPACR
jgi:hypothetical protein